MSCDVEHLIAFVLPPRCISDALRKYSHNGVCTVTSSLSNPSIYSLPWSYPIDQTYPYPRSRKSVHGISDPAVGPRFGLPRGRTPSFHPPAALPLFLAFTVLLVPPSLVNLPRWPSCQQ